MNPPQTLRPAGSPDKVFLDNALSFNKVPFPEDSTDVWQGSRVGADGSVDFAIRAPHASSVVLRLTPRRELALERDVAGLFTGTLPFDPSYTGPLTVDVLLDGDLFLSPYLPICWSGNRPANQVEVPDPEDDYLQITDVPHGAVSAEIYWSGVMENWERALVYTPAGFARSDTPLPVLYLLNGGGENETAWVYTGRVAHILDNLIGEGSAEPMLVVMGNGMLRHQESVSSVVDDAFERMLVEDCIPFIESSRPVRTDKWSRAVAGLSMGAYMANDIGLGRPELFGSIGQFTASMTHESTITTYERPFRRLMSADTDFERLYRVFYRSTTPQEDHLEYFEADDALCAAAGLDRLACYHRRMYAPRTSKWNSWRQGLRDFVQLLFKEPPLG